MFQMQEVDTSSLLVTTANKRNSYINYNQVWSSKLIDSNSFSKSGGGDLLTGCDNLCCTKIPGSVAYAKEQCKNPSTISGGLTLSNSTWLSASKQLKVGSSLYLPPPTSPTDSTTG